MRTINFVIFCLAIIGCNNSPRPYISIIKNDFDEDVYAIIKYENVDYKIFGDCVGTELSQNDLTIINNILVKAIKDYNHNIRIKFYNALEYVKKLYNDNTEYKELYERMKNTDLKNSFINLNNYKRQYVAVINDLGEKIVWVNCFNSNSVFEFDDWKKRVIDVYDGYTNFFNLKINITKMNYFDFLVN